MITRIDKVNLFVNSQDEAKAFWTQKVGFVVTAEQPMGPDMTWLEVAPSGENMTSLVLYSKELMLKQHPEVVHHPALILATDDAETEWQRLKHNGVEVTDVQTMPFGKLFSFKDNDGNSYMVASY